MDFMIPYLPFHWLKGIFHCQLHSWQKKNPTSLLAKPFSLFLFVCFWCGFVSFFGGGCTPMAYRSSEARGRIGAAAANLHHSHSNAKVLTHGARPGIEPASSWILAGFVTAEPRRDVQTGVLLKALLQPCQPTMLSPDSARPCFFHPVPLRMLSRLICSSPPSPLTKVHHYLRLQDPT